MSSDSQNQRRRPTPLQAPPSSPRSGPPIPSPLPSPIPSPFPSPSSSLLSSSSSSSTPLHARPLLRLKEHRVCKRDPHRNPKCGEITGGATAGCAAVLCCCPFCIMDFTVLMTLRLPAGLCKKVVRRRWRSRKKIASHWGAAVGKEVEAEEDDEELEDFVCVRRVPSLQEKALAEVRLPPSEDMERLEDEMWAMFDGAGFCRSRSRREEEEQRQPGAGGVGDIGR